MIDALREIIQYTHSLGFFETVKVTGTPTSTQFNTVSPDKTVIVQSQFNTPIPEFAGVFGLPNLDKLSTILSIPEYATDSKTTVGTRLVNGVSKPANITFENKAGDFVNEYRLMGEDVITTLLPPLKFNAPTSWDITISPSAAGIQKLKFQQAAASSTENSFLAKVEHGNLKFFIGDHSTHAGNFVFEAGVTGTLKNPRNWPLKEIIAILGLPGDKVMQITDAGLMQIIIDSGTCTHEYLIPGLTK